MLKRFYIYLVCIGLYAILPVSPIPGNSYLSSFISTDVYAADSAGQPDLSTAIVRVAKQAIPAVVHIEVTETQEIVNPMLPFEEDPFFRHFFGTPKNVPKKFKRELMGLGTGMIIDSNGHIVTNNHVVAGASKIQVLTASGDRYPAKIVGTDPKTDLAVIRISTKKKLPYLKFGDSDKVEVGQWVVAIGHPRGFDQTVTQGIISAKHRTGISDPSSYQDYLQTDAAINPGNSGGPLLNLRGEVIGINAVIVSESGGFEGIGFAIPSDMASYIAKQLIAHGKIQRGWLAVSIQDITPELAKSMNLGNTKGALIAEVVKKGPAEKAGLKKGDVVIEYNGKEIKDSGTLRNEVAISTIGSEVKVDILRDGKKMELSVKIGDLEDAVKILSASIKERLGGEFRSPTDKETKKYGLESGQGVVVVKVDPKGPLAEPGFEPGDMILEINSQAVEGMDGLISILGTIKPGQKAAVLALDHRTGNSGYVQITVK